MITPIVKDKTLAETTHKGELTIKVLWPGLEDEGPFDLDTMTVNGDGQSLDELVCSAYYYKTGRNHYWWSFRSYDQNKGEVVVVKEKQQ